MLTNFRLLCSCLLLSAVALAQGSPPGQHEEMGSPVIPNPAFDKIRTLAGSWEGTVAGKKVSANYKVMSAGSAVMLVQEGDDPSDEMVTVFHPDNKDLMVTHYCSAKNQPRMRMLPGTDPNVIKFEFLDATNLPSPNLPHMVGLTLKLLDGNHHVQSWTFSMNGKTQTEDFDLRRKM
jgi:hypothetical protein